MLVALASERLASAAPWPGALAGALDPSLERPHLRADAELHERLTRWGERDSIVHAPGTPYVRLHDAEIDLVRRLDGTQSLASLCASDLAADAGLGTEAVTALVSDLHAAGLLVRRPVDVYALAADRLLRPAARRGRRVARFLREQTIAIGNADAFADWCYRHGGRFVFSLPGIVLGATVALGGLVALVRGRGGESVTNGVNGSSALVLLALMLGALMSHELAHALAVKRAGRSVVAAGFRLYLGHPAFFIDSTDLVFASPRQRAVNAAAGPFMEAAIAGVASLAVWFWPGVRGAHDLYRFAVVGYANVALNVIPFVELDGYWLLTDLLDTPRLRARAFAVLRHEVPARLRRRRPPLTRAEGARAVFGVLGLVFTVGAVVFALGSWLPVSRRLVALAWNSGVAGRIGVALVLALAAGPIVHVAVTAARWLAARIVGVVADLRFRAQTRWRVEAAEAVAALPVIGDIDDDTLSDLAGRVHRRRVRAGTTVIRQGESADEFFVVRRGAFDVVENDVGGGERLLRRVHAGDSFGELSLLDGRPRTATVRATQDSEVFVLDAGAFKRLIAPTMDRPALNPALGPALEVQSLPPFRTLALSDAALVAEEAAWLDVAAGVSVVRQGESADAFYVVLSGQATVERDGIRVGTLRTGDHFGELALLDRTPRQATVRTTTPARLLRIDSTLFHELVAAAVRRPVERADRGLGGEF